MFIFTVYMDNKKASEKHPIQDPGEFYLRSYDFS